VRIVVADDAALVREGVALLLVRAGFELAGGAGDVDELMTLVRDEKPDLAIVDIRMPPTHTDEGIVAATRIRAQYPDTGVLVLSQHLEPRYAMRLLEHSPSRIGYLLKERIARIEELTDAIRRIDAGECVVDRAVVEELVERRRTDDPLARLSPREREILKLMAEGRSNQGICQALWLSPKTIETHTRSLFLKLGLHDAPHDNRRVLAVLAYLRTA
jgi:DNA-binding NarL/FixJ family response regulator